MAISDPDMVSFLGATADRRLLAEDLGNLPEAEQRRWPVVLSVLAVVAGIVVIGLGVTGLTGTRQHVRHITHDLTQKVEP